MIMAVYEFKWIYQSTAIIEVKCSAALKSWMSFKATWGIVKWKVQLRWKAERVLRPRGYCQLRQISHESLPDPQPNNSDQSFFSTSVVQVLSLTNSVYPRICHSRDFARKCQPKDLTKFILLPVNIGWGHHHHPFDSEELLLLNMYYIHWWWC